MNFFFLANYFTIFIAQVIIILFVVFALLLLTLKYKHALNFPQPIKDWLPLIEVLLSFLIMLTLSSLFYYHFTDGIVKELYIINSNGKTRLTVWLKRQYHFGHTSLVRSTRLKSYDLQSGENIGKADLTFWTYYRDYEIFEPFGAKAWAYSKRTGIALLDMAAPKIIADHKKILKLNPQLGGMVQPFYGDYFYDPVSHGMQVKSRYGQYFRINPDLTATALKEFAINYIPKYDYWSLDYSKEGEGKTLRHVSVSYNPLVKKPLFIGPKVLKELNKKFADRKTTWLLHYSALYDEYDTLLSYMDKNGQEIKRINLSKLLKFKNAKAYASFTQDSEILVFVSKGGASLSALRADPVSGEILGMIDYLK